MVNRLLLCLVSYGGCSFAYAGPSNWNSLPAYLRDSSLFLSSFKHHLKTFLSLFTRLAHAARLGFFYQKNALYKFTVNSLLLVWGVGWSMPPLHCLGAVQWWHTPSLGVREWCDMQPSKDMSECSLQ